MQGPLSAADIFVLSRDLPHNGKSRHPISGACFCVEYLILLALIGSVEERHDLCTGAVRIRAERRGRSTVRHVVRYRPVDGVSVERVRGNIREARAALDLLAEGAVQERYALLRVQVAFGANCVALTPSVISLPTAQSTAS